jgi:benzil reductase ((S)-benzoin forming)
MQNMIIVTGASSGIGRALTLSLAARGEKVLAIARRYEELQRLKESNPQMIEILSADVGTSEGRQAIISGLPQETRITALVNNAALMTPSGYLREIELEKWRYQMAVNVEGPLFLTNALLPYLQNGRILNLTIYSSLRVTEGLGAYGISKAALNMMTEYFRAELKDQNIHVGSVLPGIVETEIQKQLPSAYTFKLKERINQLKSKGELFSPETSAAFLAWLLMETSNSDFSTGIWDIYDTKHHGLWAKNFL